MNNLERKMKFREFESIQQDFNEVDFSKSFGWNLYVLDSNFYFTTQICDIIAKTEGVESVEILSPYKVRIGIGEMFNTNEIQDLIEDRIYNSFEQEIVAQEKKEKAPKSREEIEFNNYRTMYNKKYFATVFVNGEKPDRKFFSGDDKDELEEKIKKTLETNPNSKVMKTWN